MGTHEVKSEFCVDHLQNALCFIYPGSPSAVVMMIYWEAVKNLWFFPFHCEDDWDHIWDTDKI